MRVGKGLQCVAGLDHLHDFGIGGHVGLEADGRKGVRNQEGIGHGRRASHDPYVVALLAADYGLAVVTKITRDCKGEGTFEVKWIKQLVNGNEAGDKEDWLTECGIHLLAHNEIFRVIA